MAMEKGFFKDVLKAFLGKLKDEHKATCSRGGRFRLGESGSSALFSVMFLPFVQNHVILSFFLFFPFR